MKRTSVLLLVLASVVAACGVEAPAPSRLHDLATPQSGASAAVGWEQKVGDLRVVHLSGTPEEMGRQMGEMCGESVRHLVETYLPVLPRVKGRDAEAVARARELAAGIPDHQMRELRATAAAAGVSEDRLLLASCIIEVFEEKACAAIAAWGDASAGGELIVGRNLDWFDFGQLHRHGLVVVRHPASGRAFVSVGYPGLPGVLTGMNADGLFVGNLVQMTGATGPASAPGGVPVMSLQRLLLEQCATAPEAAQMLDSTARTVPQNYVLADTGTALFVETDSARAVRRDPKGDVVAGTNWAGEVWGKAGGDPRFGAMCGVIEPLRGRVDVAAVERALASANAGVLSIQSIVAVPARRLLRVSSGRIPASLGPCVDVDAGALMEASR